MAADDRFAWFRDARFGMFVHWGMYSVLGLGEQILWRDGMPLDDYMPLAEQFKPADGWADRLAEQAVRAGARYMVLTTRHHDGFCLFDTATDPFNAARTGPGRDLIAEYVDACRRAGLRIGLYYSIHNWRWPALWDAKAYADQLPDMVGEVHEQVRELMSNYGTIDVLWFDRCSIPQGLDPRPTSAEFWRSEELLAMARKLQPDILVNNRAGLPADFGTPEQRVASEGERPWETCMTVNFAPGWGYLKHSSANKTAGEVLYHLVDAVRLGGNLLFNAGPKPDGSIDGREGDLLDAVGRWLSVHGEAIYGTRPEGIYDLGKEHIQGPMYHYGMWTCKGSTGYFTNFRYTGSELVISKIRPRVLSAELLTTGEPLSVEAISNGRTLVRGLPETPPDPLAPVVKVEFEGPPAEHEPATADWLSGTQE